VATTALETQRSPFPLLCIYVYNMLRISLANFAKNIPGSILTRIFILWGFGVFSASDQEVG